MGETAALTLPLQTPPDLNTTTIKLRLLLRFFTFQKKILLYTQTVNSVFPDWTKNRNHSFFSSEPQDQPLAQPLCSSHAPIVATL